MVLPSIQSTLGAQGKANYTVVDRGSRGLQDSPRAGISTMADRRSSGLQRNPEIESAQKTWENHPKACFMHEDHKQISRQSSVDSYCDEKHRDDMQWVILIIGK